MPEPVLVVHGVANRDKDEFLVQVAKLGQALGDNFELIPAWWGDRGAPAEYIRLTIPAANRFEVRASNEAESGEKGREVDVILAAALGEADSGHDGSDDAELRKEIEEAWNEIADQRQEWSDDELHALGVGLSTALTTQKPKGKYEVRGGKSFAKGVVRGVMQGISEGWTTFKGNVYGGTQQAIRNEFLPHLTSFLGDIIVYQRHREEIQGLVRKALNDYFAEHKITDRPGSEHNPIRVIAHSLGGVISFDMAVAEEPLHISKFVTMGSQPAFFHVCDPRADKGSPVVVPAYKGEKVPLPSTIGNWKNFWEPVDPFAFIAADVFEGKVEDIPVEYQKTSGIYTHSVYWTHDVLHSQIRMFLE